MITLETLPQFLNSAQTKFR